MSTEFMFVEYVEWDIGNGIRKNVFGLVCFGTWERHVLSRYTVA